MKEAQRQLAGAVADAHQQITPAAIGNFGEQNLAADKAARPGDERTDAHELRAILVAQRQQEQQVLDALQAELLELLGQRRADALEEYVEAYPEQAEEYDLRNVLFGLLNSDKAYTGQLEGLADPVILARRRDTERQFRDAIAAVIQEGKVRTYDMMHLSGGPKVLEQGAASTVQMTDAIIAALAK